jgi:predicted dehydrogenase
MRKIRTGFIGVGGIAQAHLRSLQNQESIEVVAVADISRERAEQTAQRWGIPDCYDDYHDMLARDDIESVNICTFNQAHRQPTVDALEAGKNVLVEKPMAATLEDAAAMLCAAHESDRILMVAMKNIFAANIVAAKALVDTGMLGDIYYAETVAARRKGNPGRTFILKETAGIGATADIGVYCLFDALHLMGWPKPITVSGIANNTLSKLSEPLLYTPWARWKPEDVSVEDFGIAWVRFENDAVLVFKTCWLMHMDTLGTTFFLGTKAGLKLNPLTVFKQEAGVLMDTTIKEIPEGEDLFRIENLAFADAVREGKPSPLPADKMILTNVIIQGLIDSAAAGGREIAVTVPTC